MQFESVTYAGHSAVIISAGNTKIGIDPWLRGNPLCPETLHEPGSLDLIVLTHGHSDHASDAVRLAKSYGSAVAATYELAMIMINEGVPAGQVLPMNKGGTLEHKGISVTLTHAFHSSSYDTASGPVYAGEPCGIVLRDSKRALYHAGDTALFSDMSLIKDRYAPEIAFLPIGDRFTMGPEEAAKAAQILGVKKTMPIHYGTFDMLTGTPDAFKKALPQGIEAMVLEPGETRAI